MSPVTSQSSGSQPSFSQQEIDERILLDWGARIGVAARREGVASSQLENVIASLDSVSGREALLATTIFVRKQEQKGKLKKKEQGQREKTESMTAKLIIQAMLDLYQKGADKDHARKMLDFAKWVYEAKIQYSGRLENLTLHQLLKHLLEQLRQQRTG